VEWTEYRSSWMRLISAQPQRYYRVMRLVSGWFYYTLEIGTAYVSGRDWWGPFDTAEIAMDACDGEAQP